MPPDRSAVLATIREFDDLGAAAFLEKYGFRDSTRYDLIHDGKRYPPKAIYAVAHKFSAGQPLHWNETSGGDPSNRPLGELGFVIVTKNAAARGKWNDTSPSRG